MSANLDAVLGFFEHPMARAALRAALILIVGVAVARLVRRKLVGGMRGQERLLASRVLGAIIYGIAGTWSLSELGLSVSVLLGAAGVLTIAVGFAAQTAVSNLISGIFLIIERPFKVDEVIDVGGTIGEVVTIDLLSTKLRTYDNILVRIPNEVLLKAEVKNLSHYPIRRVDMDLRMEPHADLEMCRAVFFAVASAIPLCLDEPRPALLYRGFDEAGIVLRFSVWAATPDFVIVRNEFQERLSVAMAAADLDFGVPQRKIISAE